MKVRTPLLDHDLDRRPLEAYALVLDLTEVNVRWHIDVVLQLLGAVGYLPAFGLGDGRVLLVRTRGGVRHIAALLRAHLLVALYFGKSDVR